LKKLRLDAKSGAAGGGAMEARLESPCCTTFLSENATCPESLRKAKIPVKLFPWRNPNLC
jgi:hypothetical protein